MSFIKESTDQAREAFVSMPMPSRVITVMLAAAIAIGLAFLVRGDSSTNDEFLFGGQSFDRQELAAVERAFSRAGLSDWKREGQRIQIPSKSKNEYLAALEDSSSLPMSMRSRVQDAIDSMTVFDSSELREAKVAVGKELDLADTIMKYDDVKFAKVEYDRGERMGLGRGTEQSCSVFVEPEGAAPLAPGRIAAIADYVRSSFAGLKAEDVQVIDANSMTTNSMYEDEDPMLRKEQEAEDHLGRKVRIALKDYPARIAVRVEVDPAMGVEKTALTYDAEPTNLLNKSSKTESTTNRPVNRGVPGAATNAIGNRPTSIEDNIEVINTKEDERESLGVANQQYENSRLADLQVKRATVSVGIPHAWYREQYIRKQLLEDAALTVETVPPMGADAFETLKGETEETIKAAILPLLPSAPAGDDPYPLVSVWVAPDTPIAEPPDPQTAKMALAWLADSWQTIALVFLGFAALLVARSAAKATAGSTPTEFSEGFGLELPEPPVEPEIEDGDGDSMTITGGSLKDELLTLVEGNPEVAANVIRSWIGEAA